MVSALLSSDGIQEPRLIASLFLSLSADIEWKLIYVGSAESEQYDQELDNCMVGPVPVGESSIASLCLALLPF